MACSTRAFSSATPSYVLTYFDEELSKDSKSGCQAGCGSRTRMSESGNSAAPRPYSTTSSPTRTRSCWKMARDATVPQDDQSKSSDSSTRRPSSSMVLAYFDEELSRELGTEWRYVALRKRAIQSAQGHHQHALGQLAGDVLPEMPAREELQSFARDRALKVEESGGSSSRQLTRAVSMATTQSHRPRWSRPPSTDCRPLLGVARPGVPPEEAVSPKP